MSEPPPASSLLAGKIKKASCTGGTNVSKKLFMEFQDLIAFFACYDLPLIAGGGVALTEPIMEKLMMKLCIGDNDGNNVVCYADQFLLGLDKFKDDAPLGLVAGLLVLLNPAPRWRPLSLFLQVYADKGISTLLEMPPLRGGCFTRSHLQLKPLLPGGRCCKWRRKRWQIERRCKH